MPRYWLMKSEPSVFSIDDLSRAKDGTTRWDGVRNYQARNLLRDEIAVGDGVLFYHSNAEPTAIVGVAKVVRSGYPDPTAFDRKSPYFDADSSRAAPRWFAVDVAPVAPLAAPLTREQLKREPRLAGMMVLRRGARLSVQPVAPAEWRAILELGAVRARW